MNLIKIYHSILRLLQKCIIRNYIVSSAPVYINHENVLFFFLWKGHKSIWSVQITYKFIQFVQLVRLNSCTQNNVDEIRMHCYNIPAQQQQQQQKIANLITSPNKPNNKRIFITFQIHTDTSQLTIFYVELHLNVFYHSYRVVVEKNIVKTKQFRQLLLSLFH